MARSNVVTTKQVPAIRELRAGGGWTNKQIAARFGISPMTVSRITTGVTYPDLPGPITPKDTHAKKTECWRGHRLDASNRRHGVGWQDCKKCHTIRNREYAARRKARAS